MAEFEKPQSGEVVLDIGEVVVAVKTDDYNLLQNKPVLNGRTLEGNFTLTALDVSAVPVSSKLTNSQIEQIIGGI